MKKILPADLPGIDVESALTRLGDDEELLADLIVSFREDNLTTIDNIRHALETNDQDLARRLVHTLKGVSGNIGAEPLYDTSKKLEIAIKEQNKPAADTLLEIAKKEIEDVFVAANLLQAASRDETSEIYEASPDCAKLAPVFCELRDMLKTNNLKALQLYDQLEKQLPETPKEVDPLNQCLRKLDFQGALEHLYFLADKYGVRI